MKRVIVIGGGITGLAVAYRLKTQARASGLDLDLQLLEASPRVGGVLHSTQQDGFLLEGGPDCFLSEKPRALQLCQELGLANELIDTHPGNRRSFVVRDGRLYPIPEGFYLIAPSRLRPFLLSPLLSWRGKWRVLAEPLIPAHAQNDESLASFVRRRLGKETLDWLAQPLLGGIYAADPETLSLQATFPQFLEMEEKQGSVLVGLKNRSAAHKQASGARYSLFVTLRGGMEVLAKRLEKELDEVIQRGTVVQSLLRRPESWDLGLANGQHLEADAACLALPAYRSAELLASAAPSLSGELAAIPYVSSATINLAYRQEAIMHPLDGFGFVTPRAENRTVMACTFAHRKFAGRAPAGQALLRAFVGGALQSDLLQLGDKELLQRVQTDLNALLGIKEPPLFSQIERWKQAMPQYTVGHVQRILHLEETALGYPGLALAGNWLRGVGIPDCIESGERAADQLLERLSRTAQETLRA